ncbi:acyl-CoA 6-desaturase (Delta-6 desaturase) [Mytilus galloprovincialis]|uniref:Acyl-CoA 6-desaturase (Delta-6 desaturase) n=1 Tax=Mytilus galloprovincialis TaxID=29158 RepID=A0A8B6ENX5_MYTGA|nr:acyl-CoA 6-desaturase (Delta-6 desaturase) [Mytilus galloprovincialis]
MGRGGKLDQQPTVYTFDEVSRHDKKGDRWIVIQDNVYDITDWSNRHPGGSKVIGHYAGQDATDAFEAFHNDLESVKRYLKPLHMGTVKDAKDKSIKEDFRKLRLTAVQMGLFKANFWYFALYFLHVVVFEILAYLTLYYFGSGWIPFVISLLFYGTFQAQSAFLSHDFGHLAVFHNTSMDRFFEYYLLAFNKGASPHWWNHMHFQHHAKPNVIGKDPDVRLDKFLVVGQVMPVEVAQSKNSYLPFNLQDKYFPLFGPTLLFPIYFHYTCYKHVLTRKLWVDLAVMIIYNIKFLFLFVPMLGWGWTLVYYEAFRVIDSMWFAWVTQSNHIPMNIDHDDNKPWLKLQLFATCDHEQSLFNDWFTGRLNFQIEHHLFPTMPQHNLYKVRPLVQALCKKHGIPFQIKSLQRAFGDILRSLKDSGELWSAAYHAHHLS